MAIEIAFSTKFGDEYVSAYARIVEMSLDYSSKRATVHIAIYKSSEDRAAGKLPVEIENYTYLGEEFDKLFQEISVEKVSNTINPIRNIYEDVAKKDEKYGDGSKLFDEFDGKEISKEEAIKTIGSVERKEDITMKEAVIE